MKPNPPADEASTPPQGQTLPQQAERTPERVPRAPHERDESADSQSAGDPADQAKGALAHDDVMEGRRDTTKGAELDATYDRLRRSTPQPDKKRPP
jgi:hypothetical protein